MKKIDYFTNKYPVSKTLRFKLTPVGKTAENFDNGLLLANDKQRAEDYKAVKKMMDRYHKDFIERKLTGFSLPTISDYAALYYKKDKSNDEKKLMKKLAKEMRTGISTNFSTVIDSNGKTENDEEFKNLFAAKFVRELLPGFIEDEEQETLSNFSTFTTYFLGFHENRKNMYTAEGKSTEIAFRIIDQNLPKFLDNCRVGEKILEAFEDSVIKGMNKDLMPVLGTDVTSIFDISYFDNVLSQSGIDRYNQIIGGFVTENGRKIKGYNEYVNELNQKGIKLPKLKPLFKQILSDRDTASFIPESFESDSEVIRSIRNFYLIEDEESGLSSKSAIEQSCQLFSEFGKYDTSEIFVMNGPSVTDISNKAFGNWSIIQNGLNKRYAENKPLKKNADVEKYNDERRKYFKRIDSFSVDELQEAADYSGENEENVKITGWVSSYFDSLKANIDASYSEVKPLLERDYPEDKQLCASTEDISLIKTFLDAIMEYYHSVCLFSGKGTEENKNDLFYGAYAPLHTKLSEIIVLYNTVRNYVTKKPYSNDKIKINFENQQLLDGWDVNKEKNNKSIILRKGKEYYLGIIEKQVDYSSIKWNVGTPTPGGFEKMVYKQIPNALNYFSKRLIRPQNPPENILKYLEKNYDNNRMTREQLTELFSYVAENFIPNYASIHDENGECYFNYRFRPYDEYPTWYSFCKDLEAQSYNVKFVPVADELINSMVENGTLYLFKLANKDFSEFSKGTPNLHTLYFKMLFDEINLSDIRYVLNGGGEMFYREPSIKEGNRIVHPANKAIENKNPDNPKKQSVFDYDIIKDRRYTERQFFLHVPITMNPNAEKAFSAQFNADVREQLKVCDDNYVIGIDRGERNLLYICVIDGKGNIVEQHSLNSIINEHKGVQHKTDYHKLLDSKESERLKARQDWQTIENISNLKEGYISQVVHKICELVEKYDAVIAMEDLNMGFKSSRGKVEKQVYQKFEKMLIDKLNFYADKKKSPDEVGGLLNAYQLTNKFESFAKMGKQNGFIFYIPAWLTSKIDPTTGFVDLLKPRYESLDSAKRFFDSFDRIGYNAEKDYFEFELDYDNFQYGSTDYAKQWTLCTYGERIKTFRSPENNSQFVSETVNLTDEFKKLFDRYGIEYHVNDIRPAIEDQNVEFYKGLISLTRLMLQMRNSVTGTDIDYLISPVKNANGKFYCSNDYSDSSNLPCDADANGAYNIARKAQWAIEQIKNSEDVFKASLAISNADWLEYAQTHCIN